MSLWDAALLGLVQGATEFLPVSSSGHLVVAQELLDIHLPGVVFEVTVHVATLASILLVYRERVASLVAGLFAWERDALRYAGLILLASVPAGVVGVVWGDAVERLFERPAVAGWALLVTGAVLWTSRRALEREGAPRLAWSAAFLIGLAQLCALVPGISRSGATVVAALWLGVEAEEAAAFSFLMAVPAIAGAAVLQVPDLALEGGPPASALLLGGVIAAVCGVLAIRTFVAMLGRRSFHFFAPYCAAVGVLFLAYLRIG